ncbi:MAG: glycosyltransferase family 4 protein [Clostridiales bacterium]|nr:glycosyltransferase family 4 protein [Clostridiales bacterium]
MRVFQVLTTLSRGDAVSNDTLAIQKLLMSKGIRKSVVYAEHLDPKFISKTIKPYHVLPKVKKNDIMLYHLSTGTMLNEKIKELPCRKFVIYHNMTPPDFFVPYSGATAKLCAQGIEEAKSLKDTFEAGICDSQFNLDQLRSYGYTCPLKVGPILVPFEDYTKEPDAALLEQMGGPADTNDHAVKNVLFVGRIVPNKKPEDLMTMLYAYRQMYKEPVRLILAGSTQGMEKYTARLRLYAKKLGLEDIIFTGHITFPQILAYYRSADAFVQLSEHEGFCVPLLEAMFFKIPIIAFDSCAMPETLGGTGVLLHEKDPALMGQALHEVLFDRDLRAELIKEQDERLKYFYYENVSKILLDEISEFTGAL